MTAAYSSIIASGANGAIPARSFVAELVRLVPE
jgi:hypothetical protein